MRNGIIPYKKTLAAHVGDERINGEQYRKQPRTPVRRPVGGMAKTMVAPFDSPEADEREHKDGEGYEQ